MSEIAAALIGAMVSALLMVLGNRSNKRQGDIREIFHRLNAIDKELVRLDSIRESCKVVIKRSQTNGNF